MGEFASLHRNIEIHACFPKLYFPPLFLG